MKKRLIVLVAALTLFLTCLPISAAPGDTVYFEDTNLKQEVNRALHVTDLNADITEAQMQTLLSLRITGQYTSEITSLEGLQYATNLNTLRFGGDFISKQMTGKPPLLSAPNLDQIMGLNKLIDLAIFGDASSGITMNQISQLKLTTLHLNTLAFDDISGLANLTDLTTLILSYDNGTEKVRETADLSTVFNSLTELKSLQIQNYDFTQQPDFGGLIKLTSIVIDNTGITDISSLNTAAPINHINIRYNESLTDVSSLANFPLINSYNLSYNNISDVSFMQGADLSKLTSIYLYGNKLTDLDDFSGVDLPLVTDLILNENLITDISGLTTANMPKLDYLHLAYNQIGSLPATISNLTTASDIRLNNNKLVSVVEEIADLTNLNVLTLSNNQLANLPESIGTMTNLQYLTLSGNQLTSLPNSITGLTLTGFNAAGNLLPSNYNEVLNNAGMQVNGSDIPFQAQDFLDVTTTVPFVIKNKTDFDAITPESVVKLGSGITLSSAHTYQFEDYVDANQQLVNINDYMKNGVVVKSGKVFVKVRATGAGLFPNNSNNALTAKPIVLNFIAIHEVNFDLNGATGTTPTLQKVDYGSYITQPKNPTRSGYTFTGWNTSKDGRGILWDFDSTSMPDNNITLYAQWSESNSGGNDGDVPILPNAGSQSNLIGLAGLMVGSATLLLARLKQRRENNC